MAEDVKSETALRGAGAVSAGASRLSRAEETVPRTYLQQSWARFKHNRLAVASLFVVILILVFGFGAPLISHFFTHQGYADQSLLDRFKKIGSSGHILGTDNLGRDVFTRLAYAVRVSMEVALLGTVSALTLGVALGSIAGYYGGFVDTVIMRLVDTLLSIPTLYLLIFVGSMFTIGPSALALVIAAVGWMGLSRLVRGEIMAVRNREYVVAAQVVGVPDSRIIMRHIIPNIAPIVIVWATLRLPAFILIEASLSFLGLGVHPPVPSLGNMLNGAITYMSQSWSLVFIPGFVIYIAVLAINLFGNGLRDALDPRLGER
ncbi:MAG TPA: ABC transporter permease [Thermomicrobiaceae bacterium]|nr:ABC transporter permease [Thermomicrobiaceae bacterium]